MTTAVEILSGFFFLLNFWSLEMNNVYERQSIFRRIDSQPVQLRPLSQTRTHEQMLAHALQFKWTCVTIQIPPVWAHTTSDW